MRKVTTGVGTCSSFIIIKTVVAKTKASKVIFMFGRKLRRCSPFLRNAKSNWGDSQTDTGNNDANRSTWRCPNPGFRIR